MSRREMLVSARPAYSPARYSKVLQQLISAGKYACVNPERVFEGTPVRQIVMSFSKPAIRPRMNLEAKVGMFPLESRCNTPMDWNFPHDWIAILPSTNERRL